MKTMKKMMALVLAVAMCLAMSMTTTVMSFADGEPTIKVANTDTHKYTVYQILAGTLASEGSRELGDPAWGEDVTETTKATSVSDFITALKTADATSAQAVVELVSGKVDLEHNKVGRGTVDKDTELQVEKGYYLLVDVTELKKYGENPEKIDTKALSVIEVFNTFTIQKKWGTTQDDKIITTDTLGKDEGTNNINGKTDNVSVGDTVNYQITAKIPENANLYNYFYFVINDTLDPGLTFTDGSIKVYKESVADANELKAKDSEGDNDYVVRTKETNPSSGEKTFQVALNDAKSLAGKDIIVTYSAILNKYATIGETPNKNTSTVQYSNDPNHVYDGTNNPAFPGSVDDGAMGETPVTETETYTTGIEIQKVDQDGKVLTGAKFQLSGQSAKTVLTVQETFTKDNENGNYYKLKNGTYTKTAPTTDGKYMVKTPGAAAGYVIDASYDGTDKEVVDGVTYRPYAPTTDEGKDVYVLHNGNGHLYDGTDKYTKSTTKTESTSTTAHTAEMTVDANGLARFDGLGAGTYTIKETGTPSGYNTMADMTVTVTFTANGTQKWSFSGGNGSYDAEEGIYKITIENQKGTELPTTGGMGTTIFYIAGAILVIGAVVLLIARKKAER